MPLYPSFLPLNHLDLKVSFHLIPTESPFHWSLLAVDLLFLETENKFQILIVHGTLLFLLFFPLKKFAVHFHNCHPLFISSSDKFIYHFPHGNFAVILFDWRNESFYLMPTETPPIYNLRFRIYFPVSYGFIIHGFFIFFNITYWWISIIFDHFFNLILLISHILNKSPFCSIIHIAQFIEILNVTFQCYFLFFFVSILLLFYIFVYNLFLCHVQIYHLFILCCGREISHTNPSVSHIMITGDLTTMNPE